MSLGAFLADTRQQLEAALANTLSHSANPKLKAAIHYSLLGGGKRLRPALVRAVSQLIGASKDTWLIPAQAIEMIHVYSLVHDDLPAMDDDDTRRGKPSSHKRFNEATAILVGDALQAEAFHLLANDSRLSDQQARAMIALLANHAGCNGMVAGQLFDLEAEGKKLVPEQLERLHRLKTAALIQAAVLMGAHCLPHPDEQLLSLLGDYAQALGLGFQITDDILDATGSSDQLGKPEGSDDQQNKTTYVSLLGLSRARSEAAEQIKQAQQAVLSLPNAEASLLLQIADFVLTRQL